MTLLVIEDSISALGSSSQQISPCEDLESIRTIDGPSSQTLI